MDRFLQFVEAAGKKMKQMIKPLGITFVGGVLLGLLWFFSIARVPGEHHWCIMNGIVVFLWTICLSVAAARQPVATQLATATGFSWGFMFLLAVLISGNKWGSANVPISWPAAAPALLIIPLVIQVTVFPVYLISKLIHKKRIDMKKPALSLLALCVIFLYICSRKGDTNTNTTTNTNSTVNTNIETKVVPLAELPTNTKKLELVKIPAGVFTMGSPDNETGRISNEGPQTKVTITRLFWIGKYEVTQGQYQAVMGDNPSHFKGNPNLPVEQVTWDEVMEFCAKLNEQSKDKRQEGYAYRLPTEAEWEYACRAGTTTRFSFSDNEAELSKYGNYALGDGYKNTAPVGLKESNPWGLYDMHGNVWEWCLDEYPTQSYPGGSVTDPIHPYKVTETYRVIRGGSWLNFPDRCRSACRDCWGSLSHRYDVRGFRIVLAPAGGLKGPGF
jgi:formylglycine-generating enzyme required for sulfatase activity